MSNLNSPVFVSECAYCGRTTTASLQDSAGVKVPVCVGCRKADPTPPVHDPEYDPHWREIHRGTRGPSRYKSAVGINIPELAKAAGLSRYGMYKRVKKLEKEKGLSREGAAKAVLELCKPKLGSDLATEARTGKAQGDGSEFLVDKRPGISTIAQRVIREAKALDPAELAHVIASLRRHLASMGD